MDDSLDSWFEREILPHEEALLRYLARTWSNPDEILDLRQETYVRVYEAATRARPLSPKSFMFTTARHLIADRIRRSRVVSIEATADLEALNILIDEVSPEQRTSAREELRRLASAFDRLPPQCRRVVWMRKVEGISQKQVATRLGIGERAVEKQITKGVRLLASFLFGGEGNESRSGILPSEQRSHYGKQHSD
jgi:RNA polymerase sigma factor (sigma-70 family)